jgi:hypothetical protein
MQYRASFAFTVKISAKREAPDVATFDESIAEGAMDEEKGATDGCLAAGRKLTGKVNEAQYRIAWSLTGPFCYIAVYCAEAIR